MKVIDHLLGAIRKAALYNPEIHVEPACILWPDRDRQWQAVIPRLQIELPELFVLGEYAPDERTGPAIWLRCVLAESAEDVAVPEQPPILYLPGVSRQDLRTVESCADNLKPLAELQYRGAIWSQLNGKDWTILAYLKSDQGGLALDVAKDSSAKAAMQLALHKLLDEEVELLRGKRLDNDYFNTLLTGGDPARDLLLWLDQGDSFKAARSENEWKAFVEVCKSQLGFHPEKEGVLSGATKLAEHEGPWLPIWNRFCEAPGRYGTIPDQIRKCKPPSHTIYWVSGDEAFDGWPQWNEDQEKSLRRDLLALANQPAHKARSALVKLEQKHHQRRDLVWSELGEAPLACALQHLAVVAEVTSTNLAAGTLDDLISGYASSGWRADDAVVKALACVTSKENLEAIRTAVHSVYLPWIEESSRYLQELIDKESYPGGTYLSSKPMEASAGQCIMFVDGLRFDASKRLAELLEEKGLQLSKEIKWAALPTVTATGKPAVSPVLDKVRGVEGNADFEPAIAETEQPLKNYHTKKLIRELEYEILEGAAKGEEYEKGWCEFGDIDHEGHDRGWKLAKHLDALLEEVAERIISLLQAGWKSVRIVTDHGWLLLPGGLPKTELPVSLTSSKWGRCAALKPGVKTKEKLYPWFWNPNHFFALADGVSCFKNGQEYTHGGLSLQECLTLHLEVTQSVSENEENSIEVTDLVWKGLRCTIAVDGDFSCLRFDIRQNVGDPDSSVVLGVKKFKSNGSASVVVEDEELEGRKAAAVLLDKKGSLVAQLETVIGGGGGE